MSSNPLDNDPCDACHSMSSRNLLRMSCSFACRNTPMTLFVLSLVSISSVGVVQLVLVLSLTRCKVWRLPLNITHHRVSIASGSAVSPLISDSLRRFTWSHALRGYSFRQARWSCTLPCPSSCHSARFQCPHSQPSLNLSQRFPYLLLMLLPSSHCRKT